MNNNYDIMMKVKLNKGDEFKEFEILDKTLEEACKLIDKYQSRAFSRGVYEFRAHLWYHPQLFETSTVLCIHIIPGEIK